MSIREISAKEAKKYKLSPLTPSKVAFGVEVVYVSGKHGLSGNNPLWGSRYGYRIGVIQGTNTDGRLPIRVRWPNDQANIYNVKDLNIITPVKEIETMLERAKSLAASTYSVVKPYEKYIGLIALAAAIDHFILNGKFRGRFVELATALVERITNALDKLIAKLKIEPPEADQPVAEEVSDAKSAAE